MKKLINILTLMVAFSGFHFACKKIAGPGGHASITGKVFVHDYTTFTPYLCTDKFYIPGQLVYLRYGNEPGVGQVVRTSQNGTFTFENLRTGSYKVYSYSRELDSVFMTETGRNIAVLKEIEIRTRKEIIKMEDLVIIN